MKSFDIYISGCKGPHCVGCHNPESWRFDQGECWNDEYRRSLYSKMCEFSSMIDKIMLFGGEPLDSSIDKLEDMLILINSLELPVWLFTRYDILEVPKKIKTLCAYIKCGRYDGDRLVDNYIQYGIKLATSNQVIYKNGKDF